MSNQTTNKTTETRTAKPGNGKAEETKAKSPEAAKTAPVAPAKGKRGRMALDVMTDEQRAEWEATHPRFSALISYAGGKPNLAESQKLFEKAFTAYTSYRKTEESNKVRAVVEALDSATVAKIATVATDAFNKKAKATDASGVKQVQLEPFVTFIFTALGLDPFDADEKRKAIIRTLVTQLGYERVKVQVDDPGSEKHGSWVPATGKHAALYRA